MPRKYRPPAARRRKSKRPALYYIEPQPEDGDIGSPAGAEAVSTIEPAERTAPQVEARPDESAVGAGSRSASPAARHLSRDYSYVRAEVKRIVLVAGFLIVSLIVTALFRN